MVSIMTAIMTIGSSTIGMQNNITAPQMCSAPYSFSALIHLSATTPISAGMNREAKPMVENTSPKLVPDHCLFRSEEHTSELQSLMRISYAVFCLKKTKQTTQPHKTHLSTY